MFSVKKAALIAAASIAACGLGACSAQPGTALVVDGVSYSEADVTRAVTELQAFADKPVTRPAVVYTLAKVVAYTEAANTVGIEVTDADVDAFVDNLAAQGRINAPEGELGVATKDLLRPSVLEERLNAALSPEAAAKLQEAYTRASAEAEIEVNPRYGTVDPGGNPLPPVFADVLPAAQIGAAPSGQ